MKQTRRGYLATTGALTVGLAGLSGCLGGSASVETSYDCELAERDPVAELPQPTVGDPAADITVEVFEDFACPACANFATGDLGLLKDEYAGSAVKFEHHDFPIPVSDWSERVANAARSIQDAHDDETFFEFSQAAYENQRDYSWQLIGDLAEGVGADPCQVLSDGSNATYAQVLQANRDDGEQRDIPGTPGVFVNGELIEDTSYSSVSTAIEFYLD